MKQFPSISLAIEMSEDNKKYTVEIASDQALNGAMIGYILTDLVSKNLGAALGIKVVQEAPVRVMKPTSKILSPGDLA